MHISAIYLILLAFLISGCVQDSNWSVYLGDSGRQHYSALDQINRDNVDQLEVAWIYNSGEPSGTMYASPLVVDGVLYGLSPSLIAFAVNAATGEELWRSDLDVNGAQRGLMWWEKGDDKRVFFTAGKELLSLNAADGRLVKSFGENGRVDLTPGGEKRGYLGVTVPGVVYEDMIMLGFSTTEGKDAHRGSIRSYSAVDGKLKWQFNTIPLVGEPGAETWPEGSLETAGGANAWTGMALDEKRGMLFVPTGSATPDFYGANRLGDNLYANSLIAVDARTGKYIWHYQVVRHDLWDRDNPSPPTLVQMERDGKVIDCVTLTTKSGHLYVFNRDTGESMYPLVDVETLPSTLPGEVPAPIQTVSSVTISRQSFEITDRTPEAKKSVEDKIEGWDLRPWAPPRVGTVLIYPWYDGGAEWGGSAFDPATNRLIINSNDEAGILELTEIPIGSSRFGTYATNCGGCHGLELEGTDRGVALTGVIERLGYPEVIEVIGQGKGQMPALTELSQTQYGAILGYINEPVKDEPTTSVDYALGGYVYLKDHEGLPGNSPPWGTLNSFDLATGKLVWKVPFGNFLSHPELGYGAISYGGPVVTGSGLIFIAATPDKKFRAYDSTDGKILWETELTAAGFSTPAVYSVDGVQYVAISAGGGRLGPPSGSDYYAFRLPADDAK